MDNGLGARMKDQYEFRFQTQLPRRTYTIIRIDGKCFHAYTRGMERPYCAPLAQRMDLAAMALTREMMGCAFAFGQSDEYSFLLTDFAGPKTEAWFDGNVQKITSIAASIFTAAFNTDGFHYAGRIAHFDARVFCIPDPGEVENYFIWRQQDATRNSIQMAAHCQFSHKELLGKDTGEMQEMLFQHKGINWNNYPTWAKRGRVIRKVPETKEVGFTHKLTGERQTTTVESWTWKQDWEIPIFTQDREYLRGLIPQIGEAR